MSSESAKRLSFTQKPGFPIDTFKRLWQEQRPVKEMAEMFSVSQAAIFKAARNLQLKSRSELAEDAEMEWTPADPTLEEIVERAAAIRETWPEAEKKRRMNGARLPVEIRRYVYHSRTASFSST